MAGTGFRAVAKALTAHTRRWEDALAAAIYEKGHAIDADMVPLIPVRFGRLRGSHYVSPPTGRRNPVVEVGVGTDYALPVHEREDVWHRPPTRAKFLEVPLAEHRNGYSGWIAERTRRNYKLRKGVRAIPKRAPTQPKKGS